MSKYAIENDRRYNIWGRNCDVKLIFDCYEGESIDSVQEASVEDFEANLKNYVDRGLDELKKYIIKNYGSELEDTSMPNIFKFVVPRTVFVSKDPKKRKVLGLICHFRFDGENGIAIKYVDGKVDDIGGEQIIL